MVTFLQSAGDSVGEKTHVRMPSIAPPTCLWILLPPAYTEMPSSSRLNTLADARVQSLTSKCWTRCQGIGCRTTTIPVQPPCSSAVSRKPMRWRLPPFIRPSTG